MQGKTTYRKVWFSTEIVKTGRNFIKLSLVKRKQHLTSSNNCDALYFPWNSKGIHPKISEVVQVLVFSIPENFLFHVDICKKKVLKSSKNFIVLLSILKGVSVFVTHISEFQNWNIKLYHKPLSRAGKKKKNELQDNRYCIASFAAIVCIICLEKP